MQDPAGNLDQLAHLVPVLDDHGEPMRSSGAFAVVFKMKDESTGKEYALKCFTEDQEGRAEAYRQIADELESVDSTYVTSVKYLEKELFVDSNCDDDEFPVLLMDWIEGETMDRYIAENLYDSHAMSMLCYRFCKMAAWLRSQPFAHGDIKPDNIMVRPDGSLTLIDYDGMFVPSMKGQTSPTIGTKDFSHPLRTKEDFDETIDDFALASIALSLKAIALSPSLFDEYGSSDRLLFSADDYRDLSQSKLLTALHPLMTDSELNTLLSLFLLAHATKTLSMVSFRLFFVSKPECVPVVDISTKVTNEDLAEAVEDEFGVKYSKDRKRLLRPSKNIKGEYHIRRGTICICDDAFYDCTGLACIVIPEGVKEIGLRAFNGCTGLTSIVIPEGVTKIGGCAFHGCTSLTSIVIPEGVKEIGWGAFNGCTGLTSIVIPEGVKEIGLRAFNGCTSLTDIAVSVGNSSYVSKNNCCLSKDLRRLIFGCRTSIIPEGVSVIEEYAFYGCTGLACIVIPEGVTKIDWDAFSGCTGLTNIVIPDSVTEINGGAFFGCTSLTSIVIPKGVTKIGGDAFRGCTGLTNIVIPDSVTEINEGAFRGCTSLTSAVIPEGVTKIDWDAFSGCTGLTSIVIPDSVTEINGGAFSGCTGLTSVVIPEGVKEIGWGAFNGCTGLTSIVIPEGVKEIGYGAFSGCTGLTSVVIPGGVRKIGDGAFYGCTGLTSVVIPDSVTEIGCGAFRDCIGLTSVVIPDSVTEIGESAFSGCTGLTSVVIPGGVRKIGDGAFCGCIGLTSVVIPDSVTEIGSGAFCGCIGLTSVVIPDSVTEIGWIAFSGCVGLTSIEILDGVTSIGKSAFYGCNLPESVKKELAVKFGSCIFDE